MVDLFRRIWEGEVEVGWWKRGGGRGYSLAGQNERDGVEA